MKTILAAVALATATLTAPAFAENFGVSVGMGDNGYYGRIDIGNAPQPVVYNTQPVIIQQQPVYVEPVYMRVPVAHQHHWRHHCGAYPNLRIIALADPVVSRKLALVARRNAHLSPAAQALYDMILKQAGSARGENG